VEDVVSAVAKIADLPSDVIERSQEAMFATVGEYTLRDIQADRHGFNRRLTEKVGQTLEGYGVKVLQSQLTEFAPARAFVLKGQQTVGQYQLWTGF
jgi:uncharacterized membrane protein YqiK